MFEHMINFLGKSGQLSIILVLDECSSDNSLEELSLKHDLCWSVDIFSLDTQLLNH